jgi:protease-4
MKSFFKYLLASMLGMFLAIFLIFLVFIGMVAALISSQDKPVDIKPNSILLLKLDQPIHDRKYSFPLLDYSWSGFGTDHSLGLNDILNNIRKAGKDNNIKGIYLELSSLQSGMATAEEIRNALLEFKKTKKFVVAFSDSYTQGTYYLASVANKIFLNPSGSVNIVGLSAELLFFKKTLEKLDIEPEIIRHGKFKSAVEPFIYDKMSAENRLQIKTYVGSLWNHMTYKIAESRRITMQSINEFADNLYLWDNTQIIAYQLIDTVLYKDQVLDTLARLTNSKKSEDIKFISHQKYLRVPANRDDKGYSRNKIAVIYAEGDIVGGEESNGIIGSSKMAATIRHARKDSNIKAIVFRVNSPGGSALASEVIWRELSLARKVKPVIASMGDLAASGGYYIVAPADTIVASPNTLTGSIGVFGLLMNAGDFFEEKLGITSDVENTNAYSDFGSVFRPMTNPERMALQNMVDVTYSTFVSHVSQGREMPFENVDRIAEGRVWSGQNAIEIGLADTLGGLETAIQIAAKKAKIDKYRIIELPEIDDPLTQILNELSGDVRSFLFRNEFPASYRSYKTLYQILKSDKVQARLPYEISIH